MEDKVFKKMYHKIFYDGSLQASEKAEKEEDFYKLFYIKTRK